MRRTFLVLLVMLAVGCVKTDLQPFPRITRIEVHHSTSNPTLSDPAVTTAVVDFINGQRLGWTRPFLFGPGTPVPAADINLYDDTGWIGKFSLRSSVLPGGHALVLESPSLVADRTAAAILLLATGIGVSSTTR